jgi:hypothetical protein
MSRSMISKEKLMNVSECLTGETPSLTTIYSNSRKFHDCDGTACVLITTSSAAEIAVTQQCSTDDVTWYDPETAAAAAGVVDSSISADGTVYMSYTPVLCDYIRFKVIAASAVSNLVSLTLVYRVEV